MKALLLGACGIERGTGARGSLSTALIVHLRGAAARTTMISCSRAALFLSKLRTGFTIPADGAATQSPQLHISTTWRQGRRCANHVETESKPSKVLWTIRSAYPPMSGHDDREIRQQRRQRRAGARHHHQARTQEAPAGALLFQA